MPHPLQHRLIPVFSGLIALVLAFGAVAGAGRPEPWGPPGAPAYPRPFHPAGPDVWVLPAVTGAIIGAAIASQPRTVVIEQPTPVTEIKPGTTYKRVQIYIPECQCYRTYEVPID
ncbi:MAG: hypothetical protein C1943_15570 [Halochromatium sp.]|nr:hypothetical protein [Halochromatium sp.]